MVQRLLMIEFPYMYVDDVEAEAKKFPRKADRFRQKDPKLKEKLMACRPGILRWLVEGCREWIEHGLQPPQAILDGVSNLARDEDYIGQFIDDCLVHHPDQPEPAPRLHRHARCLQVVVVAEHGRPRRPDAVDEIDQRRPPRPGPER